MPNNASDRIKDPDDITYHSWDWTTFLDGETISASVFTAQTGLTKDSESTAGAISTVWLSGGTQGESYKVSNQITTSSGRKKTQSFNMLIAEL